jgi:hypothetical protein
MADSSSSSESTGIFSSLSSWLGEDPPDPVRSSDAAFDSTFSPSTSLLSPVDATNLYQQEISATIYITHVPSGKGVSFKGMLTQFSDQFTSNWNPETVYGRMDDIHTFQNTKRQINIGFVIPAFDAEEARCNLSKVTTLARMLYPSYSGDGTDVSNLTKAPLLRLKFMNFVQDGRNGGSLLGKMNGFSFAPVLESGFFDYPGFLYPKTINVDFTYDVLHEHVMGWTENDDAKLEWDASGPTFPYSIPAIPTSNTSTTGAAPTEEDEAADVEAALSA